jgi:modulator of FtsH protease HflK
MSPTGPLKVAGSALIALWGAASVYVIRPSELAIALRFGAPRPELLRPGLHFCPRGIEAVLRVEATRTLSMEVGATSPDSGEGSTTEPLWLTGDTNILTMRLTVQYQISDPVRYLLGTREAPEVLRRATETALTESLASIGVDDVLTIGRAALMERVRVRAQALLDGYAAGLHVVSLTLQSAEPPAAVMAAFKDVQDARSDRERLINEARGYANETVPRARGQAETLTSAAVGERGRRVEAARGDAGRFESVRSGAARLPDVFRQRLYLEALERLLPRLRIYVIEPGANGTRLRLVERAPGQAIAMTGTKP